MRAGPVSLVGSTGGYSAGMSTQSAKGDSGKDDFENGDFEKGDEVTWQSHGSTVEGTVEEEITSDTKAAHRTVRASEDDPQYRVRSDKSGKDAVHKPDALKKKSD